MKSPLKKSIGEVVTDYGARVMKVFKKGLLQRSLFDFYGDVKVDKLRVKESTSVPTTPVDGDGGVVYTKSSDGKLYYKSNEIAEVELSAAGAVLTSEQVQDIVGAMFSSNTETNITVTYQDADGTIDLVATDANTQNTTTLSFVDSSDDILLRNTTGGAGSGTDDIKFVAGSNITLTHTDADNITIASADTNTQLSQEQVEDFAGALVATGGTKTNIAVTYDDANGDMDFVVASDLNTTGSSGSCTGNSATATNLSSGDKTLDGIITMKGLITDGDRSVTAGSDGVAIHVDSMDITDSSTSASGTATNYNHITFENPRLLATNSSVTTTHAANVFIKGAPVANTNQTITNAWALRITGGNVDISTVTEGTWNGDVIASAYLDADTAHLTTDQTFTGVKQINLRKFPVSSGTDGNAIGDVVYFGGTTSMTVGRIYNYKSDGTWEIANADAVATSDGLLAVALGAASDTNGMLLRGMVTLDHDPGAVGDVLYVQSDNAGTTGHATATAPSASGDCVRVVGYCVHASAGNIWFNPDNTFVEVA